MKRILDDSKDKWIKTLVCVLFLLMYPVIFLLFENDTTDLEFVFRTLVAYSLGLLVFTRFIFDLPLGLYLAKNKKDKFQRLFILAGGLSATAASIYILVNE